MKTLYLLTRDSGGDLRYDRTYACQHPNKGERELKQDYNISYKLSLATSPDEWTMDEVIMNMQTLGWTVKDIEAVLVEY